MVTDEYKLAVKKDCDLDFQAMGSEFLGRKGVRTKLIYD